MTIHTGDCIEVMAGMPADSVDAVVTDPPAAVSFMGKSWDHNRGGRTEWVAWMTEVMRECYRVLKPGGYAVVWSLPRTCHWTAWAMEDAGFIIRDQLAHIFAAGFPKGKAQLKPAREDWWLARKPGPLRPLGIDASRISFDGRYAPATAQGESRRTSGDSTDGIVPWPLVSQTFRNLGTVLEVWSDALRVDPESRATSEATRGLADLRLPDSLVDCPACHRCGDALAHLAEVADRASETPLVDALEPLGLGAGPSHSPMAGCADHPSTWDALALAVRGMVGDFDSAYAIHSTSIQRPPTARKRAKVGDTAAPFGKGFEMGGDGSPLGRWPSNVLLDPDSAALFDEPNPEVVGSGATAGAHGGDGEFRQHTWMDGPTLQHIERSEGGYSRFFLVPKADRADREPVVRDAAVWLHRERGECDKLGPWERPAPSPDEQTDSSSPERAISDEPSTDGSSSGTSLHGKPRTGQSPRATKSTTSTAINRTTDSATFSSSIPSPTSESTPGASYGVDDGGSPAASAESSSLWKPSTGISADKAGRSTGDAGPATSGSSSRRNRCAVCGKPLPRVGVHPTTKPTDLMRHLIRLVTPSGGTVLDCFAGSGSTLIAAELEGFPWIGIEKEPEYVAIAEARLNGTQRGMGLDTPLAQPVRKLDPRVVAGKGPSRPEGASASTWFTTGHRPVEEPA